jgi:hypothetical protein
MARRYIGGVSGGSSFFKQSNNPGDYTTEDIVVGSGSNKFTVPKGTYIGAGAINEDFKNLLKDYRGASTITGAAIQALYDLRTKHTNWYKDNESKENYGYTDPKTFLKDTYARYSSVEDGTITEDELLEYQTQEEDGRGVVSADAGEGSVGMEDFIPEYKLRYDIDKIEPKKIDKIDIEQKPVELQKSIPLPEVQGGVKPSKMDDFFNRLETAKVYENRPDKDSKGRKEVRTQYVFSDDNPFKPDGRYFMDEADTKGRRKKSGNLNKAREWERKNGLGIQKDVIGYIPSLEFGG